MPATAKKKSQSRHQVEDAFAQLLDELAPAVAAERAGLLTDLFESRAVDAARSVLGMLDPQPDLVDERELIRFVIESLDAYTSDTFDDFSGYRADAAEHVTSEVLRSPRREYLFSTAIASDAHCGEHGEQAFTVLALGDAQSPLLYVGAKRETSHARSQPLIIGGTVSATSNTAASHAAQRRTGEVIGALWALGLVRIAQEPGTQRKMRVGICSASSAVRHAVYDVLPEEAVLLTRAVFQTPIDADDLERRRGATSGDMSDARLRVAQTLFSSTAPTALTIQCAARFAALAAATMDYGMCCLLSCMSAEVLLLEPKQRDHRTQSLGYSMRYRVADTRAVGAEVYRTTAQAYDDRGCFTHAGTTMERFGQRQRWLAYLREALVREMRAFAR